MRKMLNLIVQVVLFLLLFTAGAEAQENWREVIDQVHFTIKSDSAVTFDWTGTADNISYGTAPDDLSLRVSATHPAFLPVTTPWVSYPGPYWEAKLTGLERDCKYYYRIGENGKVHEFRTPPLPGKAGFRVCTISDIHERSAECVSMFYQIALLKPSIVLATGDVTGAGPDGQQNVISRFHDAMLWSQSAAWMPAWGNHDWEYDTIDDLRTLKGRFDIPNAGTISDAPEVSCCGEDWGWFDYGNTRFISFPEPYSSNSWIEWKDQVKSVFSEAQANPDISFIVTFGHRSAYTSTHRRSPGDMRIRKILEEFHTGFPKYVLDLSGHQHQYERYVTETGMTHIVNSTTGSYYHEGWETPVKPADCAYRVIHYGVLVLDFTANTIQGRLLCSVNSMKSGDPDYMILEENVCDEPGSVLDSFTITAAKPVAKNETHIEVWEYEENVRFQDTLISK